MICGPSCEFRCPAHAEECIGCHMKLTKLQMQTHKCEDPATSGLRGGVMRVDHTATMRQALVTRFIGPTNYRGARIVVTTQAGRTTVPWDYELGVEENHERAALLVATSYDWLRGEYRLVGEALPSDTGYAFVMVLSEGK